MRPDIDYMIAYAAIRGYCVAVRVFSLRQLERELWPKMRGPISVRREVFRIAARDVLWALSAMDVEPCKAHGEKADDSGSLSDLDQ